MILQALYELAQREQLVDDPDFEPRAIAWLVRVGDRGELLGVAGTQTAPPADQRGKKPRPRAKSFVVPRESSRTSGDYAFFLFDKAEYVFGLDPEPDPAKRREPAKLAARAALFRQKVTDCLAATGDPGVAAVARLLERAAAGEVVVTLPEGCVGNDLFAFVYAPDVDQLVTTRPAVRAYWQEQRREKGSRQEATHRCLVSGRPCAPVDKHPPLKNVPGGTTSGVALISANSNAFESYGWQGNDNAPVSREAAEACSTALNRLLHPAWPHPTEPGTTLPRRNLRLSADTVVCYWSPGEAGEGLVSVLASLFEANPEQVGEMYRSIWRGRWQGPEDPAAFYALTLTGTQGRAVVRDWFEATVSQVAENLATHFRDLAIVRVTPPPKGKEHPPALHLRTLVRSLAVEGDERRVPAALAAELVQAAFAQAPYALSLLQRAIERARAEIGKTEWLDLERRDARAALIKAVLNRRRRFAINSPKYPEVTPEMDPHNLEEGYLLGRLMAVLERMQQEVLRDVNASVVDRYFAAASATPKAVFPRLLRNFRHHVKKAQDDDKLAGTARHLSGAADRIISGLSNEARDEFDQWLYGRNVALATPSHAFPAFLPLEQQGLFILGYHHQRAWFFMPKEERARWREQHELDGGAKAESPAEETEP